jgi:hypothetical protein
MPDVHANRTDTAICRLLGAGPALTTDLATRLGVPERTVRHRLYRLRQAGAVVTEADGLHHLAVPVPPAPIAGPLPALATPVVALAARVPPVRILGPLPAVAVPASVTHVSGALPPLAAPPLAPDFLASGGPSPSHSGHWGSRTVLAAAALGLAVVGVIAVRVGMSRQSPPPSPAPARPTWFGDAWGWMPGPTW